MLIQVVHGHPLTDKPRPRAVYDRGRIASEVRPQVVATDLYRERFDPVMSGGERRAYYQHPLSRRGSTVQSRQGFIERVRAAISRI